MQMENAKKMDKKKKSIDRVGNRRDLGYGDLLCFRQDLVIDGEDREDDATVDNEERS